MTKPEKDIAKRLKTDTQHLHDQVEAHLNSQAILSATYTRVEYARLLQQLYRAHLTLEPQIGDFKEITDRTRLEPEKRLHKAHLLRRDLKKLGANPKEQILPVQLHSPAEAWGALYVLEGSSLGGAMILKQLKKQHHWPEEPFDYYGCYGPETGRLWKEFKELLNETIPDLSYPQALLGAEKAYAAFMGKGKT